MRYVYLVKAGEDQYKIGISGNVEKRIAALQTSNINLVELVCAKRTSEFADLEKKLHKRVREFSGTGGKEWFHLSPEQAIEVAIEISKAPTVDIADIILKDLKKDISSIIEQYEAKISKEHQQIIDLKRQLLTVSTIHHTEDSIRISQASTLKELENVHMRKQQENARIRKEREDARIRAEDNDYQDAKELVITYRHASASFLQRRMRIGYAKAARLMERMENDGIVGPLYGIKRDII